MTTNTRLHAALIQGGLMLVFAAAILGTTLLTVRFATIAGTSTAAFSFLIIVLLSAYFGGLAVAVATSCVATLCFDYFYLPPVGTFTVAAFSDWVSLAAFLLASVFISRLTASAAEHAATARALTKALVQLKDFGRRLLSLPPGQLSVSGIAGEALRAFALDYCSIHVHVEGRWQHVTGAAAVEVPPEIRDRLNLWQDHPTGVMELADEESFGVRYAPISVGETPLALLVVKSRTLPAEALEALAGVIGVQLSARLDPQHAGQPDPRLSPTREDPNSARCGGPNRV